MLAPTDWDLQFHVGVDEMKMIVAMAIAAVFLLAGFYLYSGENVGGPGIEPLVEDAPAASAQPTN